MAGQGHLECLVVSLQGNCGQVILLPRHAFARFSPSFWTVVREEPAERTSKRNPPWCPGHRNLVRGRHVGSGIPISRRSLVRAAYLGRILAREDILGRNDGEVLKGALFISRTISASSDAKSGTDAVSSATAKV